MLMHEDTSPQPHRNLQAAEQVAPRMVVCVLMNGDVRTGTRGRVRCYTGTLTPAYGVAPASARGQVHAGTWGCAHRDTRTHMVLCRHARMCYTWTCTLGHGDVHGATPGRARPHTGTCTPGPVGVRLLLVPPVPVLPGGAGRGARRGFPIGCQGCQRGGVADPGRD